MIDQSKTDNIKDIIKYKNTIILKNTLRRRNLNVFNNFFEYFKILKTMQKKVVSKSGCIILERAILLKIEILLCITSSLLQSYCNNCNCLNVLLFFCFFFLICFYSSLRCNKINTIETSRCSRWVLPRLYNSIFMFILWLTSTANRISSYVTQFPVHVHTMLCT